jgi:F0F1-type ATP synthase membrane subunit c/vacuolar-type H+-ATPase subunit K
MLKIGYALTMIAGACAVGFVGYRVVRILIATPGIHPFFKAVILLAGVGVVLVLIGLVRERRREDRDASYDDTDN